jgi:hypothetical protein
MKSLYDVVQESELLTEDLSQKFNSVVNEARAYLPKKRINARDSLAERVQNLKYLSSLSRTQRELL